MAVEKKSCTKHKTFNYYCEDCQAINTKEFLKKRLEKQRVEGQPPKDGRYKYKPFKNRKIVKKYLLYIIILSIGITLLTVFWFYPAWAADINLQTQLYYNKANANFRDINFLNLWSGNFFFNKTALICAIICCIIMSLPPDKNLLSYIAPHLRLGNPTRLKALIFWWTIGFCAFFLVGQLFAGGAFSWGMYLLENAEITISANSMVDAFNVILNPSNTDFETIFIYSSLILPIINLILGTIVFRAFLNIVNNYYWHRNDYNAIANLFLIIGLFFIMGFFSLPISSLDGTQIIQIWANIFGSIGFPILSLFMYIFSRVVIRRNKKLKKKIEKKKDEIKKKIVITLKLKKIYIMCACLIILVASPMVISLGTIINLNNTAVWTENQWDKKYQREVAWTRICAGLDMFEERPIEEFASSSITSDRDMIPQIRQYDQDFAVQFMAAKIGSTYEGLADSDIVYLNNKEYWVAPKTIRFSEISGDAVQTSTELYDHIEGFLAMDTYSGDLININSKFNIDENYPIFFGEKESSRFLEQQYGYYDEDMAGSFDSDVLLGTEWSKGIENNLYTYEDKPDGTLTGLEAYWKDMDLGLMSYALQEGEHPYLINRNIETRVESILLPNLRIDEDPYLVFDIANGRMYYAVSIYTSIDIGSYSKYPILRFLGVCLVNVKDGEMKFYENPTLQKESDPTYPLWKMYLNKYAWKSTPSWLKSQLRYPEDLFEIQLEANYLYHVQDSTTWKREDDFHERPEGGDLYYIETDLGDGIEYVGIDLVEYKGVEAKTLAGMYVIRHGDHFGEAIFYHTRDSTENLIGPKTARDTYESEATQEISLIADHRHGNTLLYPIGGSIYYYIPTYSTAGDLQQLKLAGFVEAFTREVGYGEAATSAYEALNIVLTDPPGEFSLSSNAELVESDGIFNLTWTESEYSNNYSIYSHDSPITEINNSVTIEAQYVTALSHQISEFTNGTHYYAIEAMNEHGRELSKWINVTVAIPHSIAYQLEMEENMIYPDDLAIFRIEIENYYTDLTSNGREVTVNLSLYTSALNVNFSIVGPPTYNPVANSTFDPAGYSGVNFTLINETIYPGQGKVLSGYVNCTSGDIIIHFEWTLLVDGKIIYHSSEGIITVVKRS